MNHIRSSRRIDIYAEGKVGNPSQLTFYYILHIKRETFKRGYIKKDINGAALSLQMARSKQFGML